MNTNNFLMPPIISPIPCIQLNPIAYVNNNTPTLENLLNENPSLKVLEVDGIPVHQYILNNYCESAPIGYPGNTIDQKSEKITHAINIIRAQNSPLRRELLGLFGKYLSKNKTITKLDEKVNSWITKIKTDSFCQHFNNTALDNSTNKRKSQKNNNETTKKQRQAYDAYDAIVDGNKTDIMNLLNCEKSLNIIPQGFRESPRDTILKICTGKYDELTRSATLFILSQIFSEKKPEKRTASLIQLGNCIHLNPIDTFNSIMALNSQLGASLTT